MREKISEWVDGELDERDVDAALRALRDERGVDRTAWRTYHLIGDAMRDAPVLSPGFAGRVAERLAREPTVLAPSPMPSAAHAPAHAPGRTWGLRVAASIAAVTFVGLVAFNLLQGPEVVAPVAQSPVAPAQTEMARVPPPAAAYDYLLAHQRYSPGSSLQGVAPYARTVSLQAGARRP